MFLHKEEIIVAPLTLYVLSSEDRKVGQMGLSKSTFLSYMIKITVDSFA